MRNSTAGEQLTAAVSTVVAIVLLGAAVTADPVPPPSADRIHSLESDLRFQLELAFRSDRPELERRREQLDAALAAWGSSPRGPREEQVIVDWLQDALAKSMSGRSAQFPEAPDFTSPPASPSLPLPATKAVTPSRSPTPADSAPPPARPTPPAAQRPAQLPQAAAVASADASRAPRTAQQPILVAVSPPAPIIDGAPELPLPVATAPSADVTSTPQPSLAVRRPPPVRAPEAQHTLPPAPTASEVPYAWADVPRTQVEPTGEFEHPDNESTESSGIQAPIATPAIRVNLRELNARIHGYHQALGEIESATVVAAPMTERELERLITQLEALAGPYQLVQLYYEALSDAERRKVATPRAMHEAIDLMNRHVQAANASLDIFAEFDAADEAPASETPLAERLRKVAEAIGSSGD